MNFNKSHVSRNLWDFEQWLTDRGATYTKDGDSYTFASQQAMYSTPFYFSQTDITISISGLIEAVTATNPRLHLLKADGTRAKTDALTTAVSKRENVSCAGLIFDWSIPGDIKVSLPMLNEGSTALPYEPYSSEVWHDIPHYVHKTDTDTITTLPAVIYPNDTTATVGLQGNMSQTGTPTPTTPIQPQECGERTGNLFDYSTVIIGKYINASGQEVASSGAGEDALNHSDYIPIVVGTTYTFKCSKAVNYTGDSNAFCWFDSSKQLISRDLFDVEGGSNTILGTATAPTGAAYLIMNYRGLHGDTVMLNTGSTALPYEPYGYKLDISSASTTTPVYLGEVESTRRIKKLVLDGTENWGYSSSGNNARVYLAIGSMAESPSISTHYQFGAIRTYPNLNEYCINGASALVIGVDINTITSVTDFKSYLAAQYAAGTPVCVWYVLQEPETAVVNEPLMKIGDYADEVSGISIPVTAGGDTFSVGTTVQPSEVTVNYRGWHPVQSAHEKSRNILPAPLAATKSNNGITVRSDGAGRYYVSGTAENDAYITFNIPPFLIPISVGLNGNGTFSMFNTKTYQNAAVKLEFYYQGTLVDNWGLINLNRTSTNYSAMANRTTDAVGIFVKSGSTVDFQISPEFTNDGVLPTNYEPYWK